MGVDFGWGYAMWVDNVLRATSTDDFWWDSNWSHEDVLHVRFAIRNKSGHNIVIYGAEGCCDGDMEVKFGGNLLFRNERPRCNRNRECE